MSEAAPCQGCGEDQLETLFEGCPDLWFRVPGSFSVVECPGCGLVQTSPRPTAHELEAFYPDDYSPEAFPLPGEPAGRSALVRVLRWFASIPYRLRWGREFVSGLGPGRVLDIGAGGGSRLGRLRAEGWEPWFLEPRPEVARATASRLGIPEDHVVTGYAEDSDLPEGAFDLVVMDHTVEHLSDPKAVFDSIARWLKPGGRLLVTCPNFGSLESRLFGRWWFGLDMPRHLFHFSVGTLEGLVGRNGLVVEDVRPQYGVLLSPSIVIGHAYRRSLDRPADSRSLGAPYRAMTFISELVATAAQGFGYMPMMEVVFRKPVERSASEGNRVAA